MNLDFLADMYIGSVVLLSTRRRFLCSGGSGQKLSAEARPPPINSVLCVAEREDCRRPSDDLRKHQQSNQVYVHVCTFKGPRVCVWADVCWCVWLCIVSVRRYSRVSVHICVCVCGPMTTLPIGSHAAGHLVSDLHGRQESSRVAITAGVGDEDRPILRDGVHDAINRAARQRQLHQYVDVRLAKGRLEERHHPTRSHRR